MDRVTVFSSSAAGARPEYLHFTRIIISPRMIATLVSGTYRCMCLTERTTRSGAEERCAQPLRAGWSATGRAAGPRSVRELVAQPELGRVRARPRPAQRRRRRCGMTHLEKPHSECEGGGGGGVLTQLQLVRQQRGRARVGAALLLGRRVGGGGGRRGGLVRARLRLRLQQLAHGVARRGGRSLQRPPVHGRRVPLQHEAAGRRRGSGARGGPVLAAAEGTHRRSKRSAQKLQRKRRRRGCCGCAGASPALSCILLCASMLYLQSNGRVKKGRRARRVPAPFAVGPVVGGSPLGEALPADAALVPLLAGVDALVALEVAARHERQAAHVAGVRLHARVRQLVHLERRRVDERLAAQVALQHTPPSLARLRGRALPLRTLARYCGSPRQARTEHYVKKI